MPSSSQLSGWIVTLIILAAGIWILFSLGKGYIASAGSGSGVDGSLLVALDSISLMLIAGTIVLIVLLGIFYLVKHSEEHKSPSPKI